VIDATTKASATFDIQVDLIVIIVCQDALELARKVAETAFERFDRGIKDSATRYFSLSREPFGPVGLNPI
jgi:hypothetical protein